MGKPFTAIAALKGLVKKIASFILTRPHINNIPFLHCEYECALSGDARDRMTC